MKEIELINLKDFLSHADSSMFDDSKSTGILNAYLRLNMFCDGNIEFEIDSVSENGTEIIIHLPLEYLNKEKT